MGHGRSGATRQGFQSRPTAEGQDSTHEGSVSFLRHDGWGTVTLQAVRLIAQREIPAYAGMTWVVVGMTRLGGNDVTWGNDGESNLLRLGGNPCRKSKR